MQFINFFSEAFIVAGWIVLIFSMLASILALGAYIVLHVIDIIKEVINGGK